MIELRNITYKYNSSDAAEYAALRSLSLKIGKGEFIGIAGHTGSGKSTAAQIAAGLINPTSGEILIDGRQFDSAAETARTLSAISRPMPSPGISTAFIKIRSPSLCFLNASLWEGGGPKGRRERVLPLSEASDIFNALSPTRLTAGASLRGGRLSVKYCNILQLYLLWAGLSTRFFMQTTSKRRAA